MCFSAGASFGASAVLAVTGILTLQKAENKSQYLFGAIPLFFAIQQFTEGVVWLSLSNPDYASLHMMFVYLFLFFAQVVWPVWVPLSVLLLEQKQNRKMILVVLTVWGSIVSLVLAFSLVYYHPVAQINSCHIQYLLTFPLSTYWFSPIFYFIPTVIPLLISGVKRMWVFGITILLSYIITEIFYLEFSLSVWCFFAAILSVIIYYLMNTIRQNSYPSKIKMAFEK